MTSLLKWVVTVTQQCVRIGLRIAYFTEQYTDYFTDMSHSDTLFCYSITTHFNSNSHHCSGCFSVGSPPVWLKQLTLVEEV